MKKLLTLLAITCMTVGTASAEAPQREKATKPSKAQKLKEPLSIKVDVKAVRTVELSNELGVPAVIEKPVGMVGDIYCMDSVLFVHSNGKMYEFDKTGNFMDYIWPDDGDAETYFGQGNVGASWAEGHTLFMRDNNGELVIKYDVRRGERTTRPLASGFEGKSFQALIPRPGGGYVGKMTYRGGGDIIPYALAIYDDDFKFVHTIGDLALNSGLIFSGSGTPFSNYKGETLYWSWLENTIYCIDGEANIRPKYEIDFVGHNMPALQEVAADYDRLMMVFDEKSDRAALISHVIELDDGLFFTYYYNTRWHLARYDKRKKTTEVVSFSTSQPEAKPQMFINSPGELLIFVTGTDFGLIYKIDLAKIFSSR